MFFHFDQSNSGGSFHVDQTVGISHHVLVEATTRDEANNRAEAIGLYFDGCATGEDCSCCGDRWSRQEDYSSEPTAEPTVGERIVHPGDGFPAKDEGAPMFGKWLKEGIPEGFIHYADGRVEGFWATTNARHDLDGAYGWGVQFNRHGASVFPVGHDGWDESGERATVGHVNWTIKERVAWTRPEGPSVEVHAEHNYGAAWFPTQAEAKAFAEEFRKARRRIRDRQRKAHTDVAATLTDPLVVDALAIWDPKRD